MKQPILQPLKQSPRRLGTRRSPARQAKRGVALLLTLIVVITYIIIVSHFQYLATTYVQIINNKRDYIQAYWTARGGVFLARAQLKLDANFSYDSLNEDWARPVQWQGGDFAEGLLQPTVMTSDEQGKFNLKLLLDDNGVDEETRARAEKVLERLIEIVTRRDDRLRLGEDEERVRSSRGGDEDTATQIVRSIKDYLDLREVDEGDNATFDASEKGIGNVKKQSPWSILTVREVLQAERVTPRLLLGPEYTKVRRANQDNFSEEPPPTFEPLGRTASRDDRSYDAINGRELSRFDRRNQHFDNQRVGADLERSRGFTPLPLKDYVTIWGDGRVNINTASRELILALSEHLDWFMVEDILRARDEAYDRTRTIEEEEEANPETTAAPPSTDEAAEGDQDQRSFRDADIASALAFYNRIQQNLRDDRGEPLPSVETEEQVPEVWRNAFTEMFPFLTVRSRFFRVESSVEVQRQRVTLTAVFRRDQAPAAAASTPSVGEEDKTIPPEPNVRMTLIFLDESED